MTGESFAKKYLEQTERMQFYEDAQDVLLGIVIGFSFLAALAAACGG